MPLDKVHGCIKGIIITAFGPILKGVENFDLINTVVIGRLGDSRYFFTSYSGTDVPFPKMAGGIAVVVQQFGNSCSTIKTEIPHPPLKTSRMPTCHESDPTGLAGYSSCIISCEPSPFFRKAVNMGRFCVGMPVTG